MAKKKDDNPARICDGRTMFFVNQGPDRPKVPSGAMEACCSHRYVETHWCGFEEPIKDEDGDLIYPEEMSDVVFTSDQVEPMLQKHNSIRSDEKFNRGL